MWALTLRQTPAHWAFGERDDVTLQNCGHKPYALVGGATGNGGRSASGKSAERNLLTDEILAQNIAGIKKQLSKFFGF